MDESNIKYYINFTKEEFDKMIDELLNVEDEESNRAK